MIVFLALSPIVIFVSALSLFKIPSFKAAPLVLVYASLCAVVFWKFPPTSLAYALGEGMIFAIWFIGMIVFAALMLSDLLERTGSSEKIRKMLSGITPSLPATAVIVSWGLEGFLESIAGFGSGLVLPIVILRSLGLSPFRAAVCALLANSMPTAYGGVGMGMSITSAVSGTPFPEFFRALNAILLLPSLILPFLIARCAASSWKEVWRIAPVPLCAFLGQRLGLFFPLGAALSSLMGALLCFGGALLAAKFFLPKGESSSPTPSEPSAGEMVHACFPFILAVGLIVFTGPLNPLVNAYLTSFSSRLQIYPGGQVLRFGWFTDPGVPLILAALGGSLIQGASWQDIKNSLTHVGARISSTILVLLCIISLARVMSYSGMISTVSQFLASGIGRFYVFLAPVLGAAVAFTTGSITASAVLMASLNAEMAVQIGLPKAWLVAAYNAGATGANMLTPHALAIVSAVLGTREYEHALMAHLSRYMLIYVLLVTAITALGSLIL